LPACLLIYIYMVCKLIVYLQIKLTFREQIKKGHHLPQIQKLTQMYSQLWRSRSQHCDHFKQKTFYFFRTSSWKTFDLFMALFWWELNTVTHVVNAKFFFMF